MNYRNEAEFNHMWGETQPMSYTEVASPTATGRVRPQPKSTFPWFTAIVLCGSIGTAVTIVGRAIFS